MIPLTASVLASRLAIAETRQVVGLLTDFDDRERQVARSLLSRISDDARVDPVAFVTDVRQRARAQAEAATRSRPSGDAWRYRLTVMPMPELLALRDELRARVDAGEGGQPFALQPNTVALKSVRTEEPDDDLDDDDDEKPRRSVPRRRSHRTRAKPAQADDAETARDAAITPKNRVLDRRRPSGRPYRGGRFFVAGEDIGGDPDFEQFRPPWLLPPDAEGEAA